MDKSTKFLKSILPLLLMLSYSGVAVAQNIAEFKRYGKEKLTFLKSEIDSITFEIQPISGEYNQLLWTRDSIYRWNVSDDDGVDFSESVLPDLYVLTKEIGDWDQMWVSREGELMALQYQDETETTLRKMAMLIPNNDSTSVCISLAEFKADGTPEYVTYNNNVIIVRRMYEGLIDVTLSLSDTLTIHCDSIPIANITRKASRMKINALNNLKKTVADAYEIVIGLAEMLAGGAITYVAATPTPLSPYLMAAGIGLMGSGMITVRDGFLKITSSDNIEFEDGVGLDAYLRKSHSNMKKLSPEFVFEETGDEKSTIQKLWDSVKGLTEKWTKKAMTSEEFAELIQGSIFANRVKDVHMESATLRGAFSAWEHIGTDSDYEYGFVIYPMGNFKNYTLYTIPKESPFQVQATSLEAGTRYEYLAFFLDRKHGVQVWSKPTVFTTLDVTTGDAILRKDGSLDICGSVIGTENAQRKATVWVVYSTENKDPHIGYVGCKYLDTGLKEDGAFSVPLTEFEEGKTYFYRTVLEIDGIMNEGDVKTFGIPEFTGLTYEPTWVIGTNDGSERFVYGEYKITTRIKLNELTSEPGLLLVQNGQILTKYALTFEKSGNETDIYSTTIQIGAGVEDLSIDYTNYIAQTTDVFLVPCYNIQVEGEKQMAYFEENKVLFTIRYTERPNVTFTNARIVDQPIKQTDSNGRKYAITTYGFTTRINGAFWINKAVYKYKGKDWEGKYSSPYVAYMDGDMPEFQELIYVEDYEHYSGNLSLQTYFDITIAYGNTIKSSNHLDFQNNGYYITGVRIVNGAVQTPQKRYVPHGEVRDISMRKRQIIKNTNTSNLNKTLPERWRNIPTLKILKEKLKLQ